MGVDVIILGAGAAGMMCAIEAGRRGKRVLILDHAKNPGEKIRISGGGRCNFTNLDIQSDRFLSQNSRFALSALKRYTQWDFIAMVDAAGIAWHEKKLGQLFCDDSAKEIIAMLLGHLASVGVDLRLESTASKVVKTADGFAVTVGSDTIKAESLVVATGGKSIPKMGATGFGYQIASQFGLPIVETRPGLVPLTFAEHELTKISNLAGISVNAAVNHGDTRFDEGLLFTHRGLSGPSILQISSYWTEGDEIEVDLHQAENLVDLIKGKHGTFGRISVKNALAQFLPEKLAAFLIAEAGLTGNMADQSNSDLAKLGAAIHAWRVKPVGSEGYRTAEVTLGGVDTDALNARTMEARDVPGLYFIGEVVDVTGWLGGYNFQWAWSSGWAAGQAV